MTFYDTNRVCVSVCVCVCVCVVSSFHTSCIIPIDVLWVVTQCSVVAGYQYLRVPYCFHLDPEDGPPKRWCPTTTQHYTSLKPLKTTNWMLIAVKTPHLAACVILLVYY